MLAGLGQWSVSGGAECCSCSCWYTLARSESPGLCVCGVCLCKMHINGLEIKSVVYLPSCRRCILHTRKVKSIKHCSFSWFSLVLWGATINVLLVDIGLLAKVTGLYHQQLWLLSFPWFPQFRRGWQGASVTATAPFQEGSMGLFDFKRGVKRNMASCHRSTHRLWPVPACSAWLGQCNVLVFVQTPSPGPQTQGTTLELLFGLDGPSHCPGWCPRTSACTGQPWCNQPGPCCCWRNGGFAFKGRKLYQKQLN